MFKEFIQNFKSCQCWSPWAPGQRERGYPKNLFQGTLLEVRLQETGTPSKTTGAQTKLAFHYKIPPRPATHHPNDGLGSIRRQQCLPSSNECKT